VLEIGRSGKIDLDLIEAVNNSFWQNEPKIFPIFQSLDDSDSRVFRPAD
jgi:hypothetical protein